MSVAGAGRIGLALVLCLLAAGCASRPQRPDGAWLAEREAWFATHSRWQISGRVGLSDGQRAGSLGFFWQADDDRHRIDLRTTAGGRQWRLEFSPGRAELEGSEVGHISGPRPDPLVERAVGWPIPVRALSWWIRGLVPPGGGQISFADDGTLAVVSDSVWTLTYQHFKPFDGQLLPTRLEARSDKYRVRVIIGEWRFGADAG